MENIDLKQIHNQFVYTYSVHRLLRPTVKHARTRTKKSTKPSSIRTTNMIPNFLPFDSGVSDGFESRIC